MKHPRLQTILRTGVYVDPSQLQLLSDACYERDLKHGHISVPLLENYLYLSDHHLKIAKAFLKRKQIPDGHDVPQLSLHDRAVLWHILQHEGPGNIIAVAKLKPAELAGVSAYQAGKEFALLELDDDDTDDDDDDDD